MAIAIVGRGCVLPGALDPDALVDATQEGRDLISRVDPDRWLIQRREPALTWKSGAPDVPWTDRGGYVRGFDAVFDPDATALPGEDVRALDPLVQWSLHAAGQALSEADVHGEQARAGLVLGNLGFPSASLARFTAHHLLQGQPDALAALAPEAPDVRNRFMSGLPAHLVAQAYGLGAGAFALDAACASSLYALALACDRLRDGEVDLMLAGAVACCDDTFIHLGFCALQALSPSGQTRPFHAAADGLLPAEGAVIFALKRLDDAVRDGNTIHGVIRGIGLSNDGRSGGFLAPDADGQVRAMQAAYTQAGWDPTQVSLVECHATGTQVGDAIELASMARVFAGASELPIGSIKSNLGHPITAAGGAALLKVLGALERRTLPPTLHADQPTDALDGTPFRLLSQSEPWTGPRRAAVSAFGFGGNNAHLLVEAWDGDDEADDPMSLVAPSDEPIVVVRLAVRHGDTDTDGFIRRATGLASGSARMTSLHVSLSGLRFPPKDLAETLPQQIAVLEAAREAVDGLDLPRERTGVLVGMGTDPVIGRYGLRWMIPDLDVQDEAWQRASMDAIIPHLTAAGVLGTMPNIPTNRINAQLDVAGPSFSVFAEQGSGGVALRLASRALRTGQLDVAVVGAVDLSADPVHEAALRGVGIDEEAADAAVVLVLMTRAEAVRRGLPALARIEVGPAPDEAIAQVETSGLGHAHAAAGWLQVAAGVAQVARRTRDGRPWVTSERALVTRTPVLGAAPASVHIQGVEPLARPLAQARLQVWSAADRAGLLARLEASDAAPQTDGPVRLAVVGPPPARAEALKRALAALRAGQDPSGPGVHFSEAPLDGRLALAFPSAAGAYAGMGAELLTAFPEHLPEGVCDWMSAGTAPPSPLEALIGATLLAQAHARVARQVLGLQPDACFGLSSGESNALFAAGWWTDGPAMQHDLRTCGLFDRQIGGPMQAVQAAWGEDPQWRAARVRAPLAEVEAAVANAERVWLSMIYSDEDALIVGFGPSVEQVVATLGTSRALAVDYRLAVHVPLLEAVAETWDRVHTRAVTPTDVQVYGSQEAAPLQATPQAVAAALHAQAIGTVDLRPLIERAYADGCRLFVTCGPRDHMAGWIRAQLGERPHRVVALDRTGQHDLDQLAAAAAELWVAGVPVDLSALLSAPESAPVRKLTLPAHAPPLRLTAPPAAPEPPMQTMEPAPRLPPVLSEGMGSESASRPVRDSGPVSGARSGPDPRAGSVSQSDSDSGLQVERRPAPAAVARPVATGSGTMEAYRAQHARLMQTHRDFVEQQTELQRRFLHVRQRMTGMLARGGAAVRPGADVKMAERARISATDRQNGAIPPGIGGQGGSSGSARIPEASPALMPTAPPAAVDTAATEPTSTTPPASTAPSTTTTASTTHATPTADVPAPTSTEPPTPTMRPTPPALRVAYSPYPFPDHVPVPDAADAPGPTLDRLDLELHGSGRISRIFGEGFAAQDAYAWQCRMPEPPLLLADRALGIEAEPLEFATGRMWTQTDITPDRWFVNYDQRIPPCLMIECGQADLMLISWMGIDPLNNHDERVYRLLGCDLTYRGSLPRTGETLTYEIHVDGHANQGPVRLFFFHYDACVDGEPRLAVRNGQAGFFTAKELEDSAGILWDAEGAEHDPSMPLDPPVVLPQHRTFSTEQLHAFADGDGYACFGPGFERLASHTRTPRMQAPPMLIMDRITAFDPRGGPWGRGYMKVELDIHPDDWFFQGHFKNDSCMPGTLMAEGCLQAMAFYLAAMGFTLDRDGWRFEPVPDHTVPLRCRGQTTPSSTRLTCELFIESVEGGPHPTVYADLLGSTDGLKAFWARRMGLRLVPDWPLETCVPELPTYVEPEPIAIVDGFRFDYASLLACAWGRPSAAFGPRVAAFDDGRTIPRLPGAPYHFLSRVTSVEGDLLGMEVGSAVEVAWDIPEDAWYFDANGCRVMPFAVLLEAALQPCGWLASYVGSAFNSDKELRFRNLDGDGRVLTEVVPMSGTLRTRVELTRISQSAGMIIEGFTVRCRLGDVDVYELDTVFGFFPPIALANQVGVGQKPADVERIQLPSDFAVDLTTRPAPFFDGSLRLPERPLLMLDRLSGYWPEGGEAGLGRMRGEKDVFPEEWCFKLHFFSDPVQPGSLGLAALIQLLQALILEQGLADELEQPRFEAIATEERHAWKYRGQVPPDRERITSEVAIREVRRDERGLVVLGSGYLWCDGLCIYAFGELPIRVVEGAEPAGQQAPRREDGQPLPDGSQVPSGAWDTPGRLLRTMDGRDLREARLADFHRSHVRRHELTGIWGGTEGEPLIDAPHTTVETRDPLQTAVTAATGAPLSHITDGGVPELPLSRFTLDEAGRLHEQLDLGPIERFWAERLGLRDWPAEDLFYGLVNSFTRRVRLQDPELPAHLGARGALFLANHQTALESLSFIVLSGGLFGRPTSAIAKQEHRDTWMGRLDRLVFDRPDLEDPRFLAFFDRTDPAALPALLQPLLGQAAAGERSILVHVDGTRSRSCRESVSGVSASLLDGAIAAGVPVVPVRFEGGLPVDPVDSKLGFPWRYGRQDVVFGEVIEPDSLAELPLKARKDRVLDALRGLGIPQKHRMPLPGQPDLADDIGRWRRRHPAADEAWAVIAAVLARREQRCVPVEQALDAATASRPDGAPDPWSRDLARLLTGTDR